MEIIHILEQKGTSFNNCLKTSIKFHRHFVSDWILLHYRCCEKSELYRSLHYCNYRVSLFRIINGIGDSLHESSGHLFIVKYLIEECHQDAKAKIFDDETPLHNASEEGNIDIVKYLVEECHVDIETKSKLGWTALYFASDKGHFDIVKYLVEECHAQITDDLITYIASNEKIKEYLQAKK